MQPGQGQGLSLRDLGEIGGAETVTLLVSEIPVHTHTLRVSAEVGDIQIPADNTSLARSGSGSAYTATAANIVQLAPQALAPAGGSLPHNNMQPYLTLNFCIALQGRQKNCSLWPNSALEWRQSSRRHLAALKTQGNYNFIRSDRPGSSLNTKPRPANRSCDQREPELPNPILRRVQTSRS
jgi:hypothetical protein